MIRHWETTKFPREPMRKDQPIKRPANVPDDFLNRVIAKNITAQRPSAWMQILGLAVSLSGMAGMIEGHLIGGIIAVWCGVALIGFHL